MKREAFLPLSAPTEAHSKGHIEDVNGDGRLDLMLHFRTQDTGMRGHLRITDGRDV